MDRWDVLAALGLATVAFVAVGGLVGTVAPARDSSAVLAALALVALAVVAAGRWGVSETGSTSNPYWG
ncbi:hypothetical protein BRC82_09720 [Halobacteriales archaeon QS_1_67_19]|nr:MAG: hypothetical protein BRC82_09720 [Halobacteriales archaeon QS_1_67_19]